MVGHEPAQRGRLALAVAIGAAVALFLFLPSLSALLTDWWWFREIGYQIVFTRELTTRWLVFLGVGGLTAGLLYVNLRAAQRGLVPYPVVLQFKQAAPGQGRLVHSSIVGLTRTLRRFDRWRRCRCLWGRRRRHRRLGHMVLACQESGQFGDGAHQGRREDDG